MKIIRWAFAALLLACGSVGFGQTNTFTKFAPATGVLKGSSATYVTSAAVAADIKGLWSGTCDATTFLRGDGACASVSAAPGGSNTQVQFNNSSAFGGSSNLTWDNTNNFLKLTGAGGGVLQSATAKPLSLIGGDVIADITSSSITLGSNGSSGNGGTVTITAGPAATSGSGGGVALNAGNGTGSLQSGGSVSLSAGNPGAGGAGGVVAFYTNGGTLRETINYDGGVTVGSPTGGSQGAGTVNMTGCFVNGVACSTGGASGATPTGTIGLSAVAGSAGTFTRSDGTAPLSQAIVPTWTGSHTFSAASTVPVIVNANGVTDSLEVKGITGRSAFIELAANGNTPGTSSLAIGQDSGGTGHILERNAGSLLLGTNGTTWLTIFSTGGTNLGAPTGGDPGAGAMNTAGDIKINNVSVCRSDGTNCPGSTASTSATITSTGCSANGGVTGYFAKSGNVSTLTITAFACTSNSTSFTFTGFPAAYQPTHQASCAALVEDNTIDGKVGSIVIAASGTISLTVASSSGGSWTASGIKGFNNAITCSYPLN